MTIYQKVLGRAFKKPFFDIEAEYLPKDYASLYRLSRKLYLENNTVPTIPYILDVVLPRDTTGAIKKKFEAILKNLPDEIEESDLELKEMLQQEATIEQLSDLLIETKDALVQKNIKEVGTLAGKMQGVLLLGDVAILEPDNDSFQQSEKIEYIRTGLETGNKDLDLIPTGSAILLTAGTGKGKSIMSVRMMNNKFFYEEESVLYYSYEVQSEVMRARMLSQVTGVPFEEVAHAKYSMEENRLKVEAAKLAYQYKILPEEAFELALKGQLDKIKTCEKRKNILKLRSMPSRVDIMKAERDGKRIKPMPNRLELMEELNLFYHQYGIRIVVCDLITNVPSLEKEEKYKTITEAFVDAKNWALKVGGLIIAPAQADETDIVAVKYAKLLKEQSDLNLVALPTSEHLEYGVMYWATNKNRHGVEGKAYPFSDYRACSDFKYNDVDAPILPMWDVVKMYYKERKKS